MPADETFVQFLRRVRAGDAGAAAELVKRYESLIRMEVRLRITDPRLRQLFDSMDICQSVLASFFTRAATGCFDLNEPSDLVRLLVAMTRNKVAHQARRQRALRRDRRRAVGLEEAGSAHAHDADPDTLAAGRELLQEVRRRMTEEEVMLADLRAQELDWPEIAARVGGTPDARRKQLARAADRIARQLGLEGPAIG
jgi:RNA polymerase sigma-70 factor (ECF subfamily)